MGWVNPWVGLDWVGLGPNFSVCNGLGWVGSRLWKLAFFIHMLLVYLLLIILNYWNSKQTQRDSFDPFAELRDGTSTSGTKNDTNLQFSGRNELATYKAMKVPAASGGPLNFWRQQSSNCPVRRVLAISASSAQSERDFSSVAHTLTDL